MAEELRFHLDMREQDYMNEGKDQAAAREAALQRFGDVARASAECVEIGQRQQRGTLRRESFDAVRQDVMFALRQLRRNPGFAIVVILVLALGFGVNLTILGIVDAVVLHPMPGVVDPDRLMTIENRSLSYPGYRDFRDRASLFEGVGAYRARTLSIRLGGEPTLADVATVSGNFFSLLGAKPARGRVIQPSDDQVGGPTVAMISAGYWRRAFASDPAALGRVITINGVPFTIVGITDPGFRGLEVFSPPDLWVPISTWPEIAPSGFDRLDLETRNWSWLRVFARLKPGVEPAQGEASLNRIAQEIQAAYPNETPTGFTVTLTPSAVSAAGSSRESIVRFFVVLLIVVGLVLLLAAANVANLLLARTTHRRREIGVRLALGAGRIRLVRQFLTESLVLSALAGCLAVGFMILSVRLLGGFAFPGGLTLAGLKIGLDPRILVTTLGAILLMGLVLGIIPAVHASGFPVVTSLRESGSAGRRGRSRLQASLLAVQVALSLVLLVTAGLFARSLQRALSLDSGFRTDHLLTATVAVGLARYSPEQASQFYLLAGERIAALPGVEHVGWSSSVPLTDDISTFSLNIEGYVPGKDEAPEVETSVVSADFLRTLGVPVVRGRDFDSALPLGAPRTVVINQAMADRYWKGRDPVGGRIMLADTLTVIGVARNARYHTLTDQATPYAYIPLAQLAMERGSATMTLFVRTQGDPEMLAPAVRRELALIAPEVPVFDIAGFQNRIGTLLLPQRLGVRMLGAFGLLALIIASVGVYGVVGYVVARRTREVGIRMALGEEPGALVWRMVRDNLGPIALGVMAGLGCSVLVGRAAVSFLYGVSPTDPVTYLVTIIILLAASLLAALVPARRASRVSPLTALRSE